MPSVLPAGSLENASSAAPSASCGQAAAMSARTPPGRAWAEVCHCKSRLCDTSMRQSAVTAAETFTHASQGRNTSLSTTCPALSAAP